MAFATLLLLVSSALAASIGAIGVYGVISFVVTQRTREIGIRMALGAQKQQVLGMVLRDGVGLVLPGLLLGVFGAFALTGLLKSLLYGVSPLDPLTFALVPVVFLALAVGSSLVPAERASRVEPAMVIRQQ